MMFHVSHKQGFTIVELLIVVVVIGILAAITIVSYNGITKRANETAVKTDVVSASKQIESDKIASGGLNETILSQYLSKQYGTTAIEYQYGDADSFCINGINTSKNLQFYIESKDGITSTKDGLCPATYTNATPQCVANRVYVSVSIQNQTASAVTVVYSIPTISGSGQGTQTVNAGSTLAVAINTYLATIPAGVAKLVVQYSNGTSYTRYHHFDARSC